MILSVVFTRIIPARAGFTAQRACAGRRRRDHPRSRGVYRSCSPAEWPPAGSSPLARGLPARADAGHQPIRIIPARAGFTRPHRPDGPVLQDHPRSRGVYHRNEHQDRPLQGSSPLARGLPAGLEDEGVPSGIIPARAGFTPRGRSPPSQPGDHPRSRGVYECQAILTTRDFGSSPLARGLRRGDLMSPGKLRIIPARAGFTLHPIRRRRRRRDHPRSRGVYDDDAYRALLDDGSSPLARGLPCSSSWAHCSVGIIPARAGFTSRRARPAPRRRDHPRSRGVYRALPPGRTVQLGSSPLARGLPLAGRDRHPGAGIIPARAGFTSLTAARTFSSKDHPRSRGVYSRVVVRESSPDGSSPLARGLHPR